MFLYSLGVFCFKGRRNLNSSPKNEVSRHCTQSHIFYKPIKLYSVFGTQIEKFIAKNLQPKLVVTKAIKQVSVTVIWVNYPFKICCHHSLKIKPQLCCFGDTVLIANPN